MILSKEKISTSCSICVASFSVFGSQKHICHFCYKPVCSRCSMQTALDPESHIKKRICDACHSETIKDSVITQFRIELERLNIELSNLEKK